MLEILDETSEDLVAFRVSGRHIHDESHKLASMIDARIKRYGHARAFVEVADTAGVTLGALKEGLEFDLEYGKKIERCAVVGDQTWSRWLVGLLGLFFRNAEIRHFAGTEREEALEWVRAD